MPDNWDTFDDKLAGMRGIARLFDVETTAATAAALLEVVGGCGGSEAGCNGLY